MGWTTTHKAYGSTVKQFFQEEFDYDNEKGSGKVLGCKTFIRDRIAYLAWQTIKKESGEKHVSAIVCLLSYHPKDHFNFGYKDICETSGPGYHKCPKSILELLSPSTNDWSREWREKAWVLARRPPFRSGTYIQFEEPIEFTNGKSYTTLYIKNTRKKLFTFSDPNSTFFIPKRTLDYKMYTIIEPKKLKKKELPLYIGANPLLDKEIAVLMKG